MRNDLYKKKLNHMIPFFFTLPQIKDDRFRIFRKQEKYRSIYGPQYRD